MKIKNLLQIYEQYLNATKGKRRGHKKHDDLYRNIFKFFSEYEINALSERDIERYIHVEQARGSKNSNINHNLYAFKKFLRFCYAYNYMKRKLYEKIKKIKEEKFKFNVLTDEEYEKLIEEIKKEQNLHYQIIFYILLRYGCRIGEVLKLKWNEIDLSSKELCIWTEKAGGYRIFEMDDFLSNRFKILYHTEKHKKEYIFINPKTGQIYYELRKPFKRLLRKAGINRNIRIHDIRHNFALRLVRQQYTPLEIARILGHNDLRSVNHYFHPYVPDVKVKVKFKIKERIK